MIRLNRRDLLDLAENVLLANTPYSLYHALAATTAVRRMKEENESFELEEYYNRITVRARQTEIELGIAYGLLVAHLTTDKVRNPIDASRLQWGGAIEELVQKSGRSTQSIIIHGSPRSVSPTTMNQQSNAGGIIFLGNR